MAAFYSFSLSSWIVQSALQISPKLCLLPLRLKKFYITFTFSRRHCTPCSCFIFTLLSSSPLLVLTHLNPRTPTLVFIFIFYTKHTNFARDYFIKNTTGSARFFIHQLGLRVSHNILRTFPPLKININNKN